MDQLPRYHLLSFLIRSPSRLLHTPSRLVPAHTVLRRNTSLLTLSLPRTFCPSSDLFHSPLNPRRQFLECTGPIFDIPPRHPRPINLSCPRPPIPNDGSEQSATGPPCRPPDAASRSTTPGDAYARRRELHSDPALWRGTHEPPRRLARTRQWDVMFIPPTPTTAAIATATAAARRRTPSPFPFLINGEFIRTFSL